MKGIEVTPIRAGMSNIMKMELQNDYPELSSNFDRVDLKEANIVDEGFGDATHVVTFDKLFTDELRRDVFKKFMDNPNTRMLASTTDDKRL